MLQHLFKCMCFGAGACTFQIQKPHRRADGRCIVLCTGASSATYYKCPDKSWQRYRTCRRRRISGAPLSSYRLWWLSSSVRLVPFDEFFNCRIITTYRTSILVPTYVHFFRKLRTSKKNALHISRLTLKKRLVFSVRQTRLLARQSWY